MLTDTNYPFPCTTWVDEDARTLEVIADVIDDEWNVAILIYLAAYAQDCIMDWSGSA